MSNAIYTALSRQTALAQELSNVANNVANASTTGFRVEGMIFSEYVNAIPGQPSQSQTRLGGRLVSDLQGDFVRTGGSLDLAIEGEGYFVVQTPAGERLTRAGSFLLDSNGTLVTKEGYAVQGAGGGEITLDGAASDIVVAPDGVISAGGELVGQVRIAAADPTRLVREGGTLFRVDGALSDLDAKIRQGFVEASNVNPVLEIARLIEVQRAFELGQQFLASEGERIERAIGALGGARL